MVRMATKTPRSHAAAGPPGPDAEAAGATASEVPEATEEPPGDGDLGGDSGAAAATSPEPAADDPAAEERAAEDARGAMVAAPTQTFAEVYETSPVKKGDFSDEGNSEADEEAEAASCRGCRDG